MARKQGQGRKPLAHRLAEPFQRFLAIEAASTILLLLATVVALVWANSRWAESYEAIKHLELALSFGDHELSLSLEEWVNDALMVFFFFVVGMEIKHELADGELSSRESAMLPFFGALGGMIAPAGIYLLLVGDGAASSGWGIPMATDIAFAVAALAVLRTRVPSGLKVFLLALAIVDDLGAVSVIALFYTESVSGPALAAVALGLLFTLGMARAGVQSYGIYWVVGAVVWAATLASGVHATVAGVLLGLITPTERLRAGVGFLASARNQAEEFLGVLEDGRSGEKRKKAAVALQETARDALSPIDYLTTTLHPWVAFAVMPVFAFFNAGVRVEAQALAEPVAFGVSVAVALGLLVGKPVGITLFAWLAVRQGIAALPPGVGWGGILGAGVLASIGFTMALFITALAFQDPSLAAASKVGILVASAVATVAGILLLMRVLPAAGKSETAKS